MKRQMRLTLDKTLSLLMKYVEEQTPLLAVLVSPSVSVARVAGPIYISTIAGVPLLVIGKDKSDQINVRLSDCVFEYGDFRGVEGAQSVEGLEAFLVLSTDKGDALSLFEPKG